MAFYIKSKSTANNNKENCCLKKFRNIGKSLP